MTDREQRITAFDEAVRRAGAHSWHIFAEDEEINDEQLRPSAMNLILEGDEVVMYSGADEVGRLTRDEYREWGRRRAERSGT